MNRDVTWMFRYASIKIAISELELTALHAVYKLRKKYAAGAALVNLKLQTTKLAYLATSGV